MARLKLVPETKRPKKKGESLKLGRILKFNDYQLEQLIARLNFYGLPLGVHVSAYWAPDERGKLHLRMLTRVGVQDRGRDRRYRQMHLGSRGDEFIVRKLPPGRYLSEAFVLSEIRTRLAETLVHELDECTYLDGHRVFDPHTRTGVSRVKVRRWL